MEEKLEQLRTYLKSRIQEERAFKKKALQNKENNPKQAYAAQRIISELTDILNILEN